MHITKQYTYCDRKKVNARYDFSILDDAIPVEVVKADTFRFSVIRLTRYRGVIGERTKERRWKASRRRPRRTMVETEGKGQRRGKGRENATEVNDIETVRARASIFLFLLNMKKKSVRLPPKKKMLFRQFLIYWI